MNAMAQPPMPADPNEASPPVNGRSGTLKPWQLALIASAVVGVLFAAPYAVKIIANAGKADHSPTVQTAGDSGKPWQPAPLPVVARVPAPTLPPMPAQVAAPTLSGVLGRKPVDPAQLAIESPIRMGGVKGGQAQSVGAPSAGEARATLPPQGGETPMAGLLKPTALAGYTASRMAHPWATIEQGRIIACKSVTPMTSQLPGFVNAKIAQDVWSADGSMVLLDRNSDVFGEIEHGLAQGQERLFVLWRSVMTPPPNLVRITLNSPAADEMGESGLPGDVNHHVWKRIGGAVLLSGIEGAIRGASLGLSNAFTSNKGSGSSTNFYSLNDSGGSSLASQMLAHTIDIPDELHRDQALPCSIYVSGDLDFSSVYSAQFAR